MASVFCSKASRWITFTVKQSLEGEGHDAFHVLKCTVLYCGSALPCVESYDRSGSPVPLLETQIAWKRSFELGAILQMTELFE
jgi:hypothetical protein